MCADVELSMNGEGCICNIDITYEYNIEMASFRYYDVLTRIITRFSIKTNVINTYVNGHSRNDTSLTFVRNIMLF
jgi:hypothetical protein